MASGTPTVSVVMPVYNEAAFVEAAVHSVLRQTLADLELVIVDNGSTDASPEILRRIRDPRVRLFRNARNLGSAAAGNRAVRESKAALIARMDADDIALPHRLETQVAAFASRPKLALLGGQARHVDARGRPLLRTFAPRAVTRMGIAWQSLFSSPFIHSTVMFTRGSFEAAGGYDERMPRSSDFALFSRIQTSDAVANLPDVLVRFRHLQRPLLQDSAYNSSIREIIERNARHFLGPESADSNLQQMITAWPDFCLLLRNAQGHAALSEFLSAFRSRFHELYRDPAADREIARDAKFVQCFTAWEAVRHHRPEAVRLARNSFVHGPLYASAFLLRQLVDGAFRRL
ncbi:MAG TPA: glycosyltransferase [Thermoanaerobaculia bacterium]|nr:glycosyltransferase [Thermoanaerobaculia bacterium]